MIDKEISKIKSKIIHYYTDSGHFFDHTERVYNLAVRIAKQEDVDMGIVKLAALLHDVARHKETPNSGICHAEEGSKMTKNILKDEGYNEEVIKHVCGCIETHRYSSKLEPKTKEASILQDADRLDALGAICIARIFSRAGYKELPLYDPNMPPKEYSSKESKSTALNHFYEKILKLKPKTFKTKLAQKIAKERYEYIEEFIDRFLKEWNGEL